MGRSDVFRVTNLRRGRGPNGGQPDILTAWRGGHIGGFYKKGRIKRQIFQVYREKKWVDLEAGVN